MTDYQFFYKSKKVLQPYFPCKTYFSTSRGQVVAKWKHTHTYIYICKRKVGKASSCTLDIIMNIGPSIIG